MEKIVTLSWATKKRHISIDGVVLCEHKSKSGGYSTKNGSYNTIALSGLADYERTVADAPRTHSDGIIPFLPLNQQPYAVIESSVCAACKKKYEKALIKPATTYKTT